MPKSSVGASKPDPKGGNKVQPTTKVAHQAPGKAHSHKGHGHKGKQ
jgi:hypothetical protein